MAKDLNGTCLCGAVTVTFVAAEDAIGACHCDQCRRWTGSAFLEIDAVPGSLSHDGPVKTYVSSDWAERAFRSVAVVRGAFSRSPRARGGETGGRDGGASGVQIEGRGVEQQRGRVAGGATARAGV